MGSVCACGSSGESSVNDDVHAKSNNTQLTNTSGSTTNIHSSEKILDDSLKAQITEAIDEYIVPINTAYQTERDRILNEMSRSAPEPYLGLLFSEYPDVNGSSVNEMARRLVTSNEAKQQLTDQVIGRIESSFASRTADWNSTSRSDVKAFIEKLVGDAFDRVGLA